MCRVSEGLARGIDSGGKPIDATASYADNPYATNNSAF